MTERIHTLTMKLTRPLVGTKSLCTTPTAPTWCTPEYFTGPFFYFFIYLFLFVFINPHPLPNKKRFEGDCDSNEYYFVLLSLRLFLLIIVYWRTMSTKSFSGRKGSVDNHPDPHDLYGGWTTSLPGTTPVALVPTGDDKSLSWVRVSLVGTERMGKH